MDNKEIKYNKDRAPVVCVEGVNHSEGTYGEIHGHLNDELSKRLKDRQKIDPNNKDTSFTQAEIIDMAVASHKKAFPKSKDCMVCFGLYACDEDCIRAQLEAYYRCDRITAEEIKQGNKSDKDGSSRN